MSIAALAYGNHLGLPKRTGVVTFATWSATEIEHMTMSETNSDNVTRPDPYYGEYVKLAALTAALEHSANERPDLEVEAIVMESSVGFGRLNGTRSLGDRLTEALGPSIAIVLVQTNPHFSLSTPAHRPGGESQLTVDASGMDNRVASDHVASMAGSGLWPTMLSQASSLTPIRRLWRPTVAEPLDSDRRIRDVERAVEWWLFKEGFVTSSFEEFVGRAEWWPTLILNDRVPTRSFTTWVVERTPNRAWTTEELEALERVARRHGWQR